MLAWTARPFARCGSPLRSARRSKRFNRNAATSTARYSYERAKHRPNCFHETSAMTLVTLTLTEMAFGGEAIGHLEGRIVFVPYGLPGERVTVELTEDRRDFARGQIVEILEASP